MNPAAISVIIVIAMIIGVATIIIMRGGKNIPPTVQPHRSQATVISSFVSGVVMVAVSLILIILLSAAYTTYEVQSSQQKWCDTLNLLTSHPVSKPSDPAANPSREQSYVLYTDFLSLKDRFGCG